MKQYWPIVIISLIAIACRVWFWSYTHYTAEDANITFQFSKRIVEGNGFALNPGQPIYGSTTPLLTLILSGWYYFFKEFIIGSKLIALFASVIGLWFLYYSIENKTADFLACGILAISFKLIAEEMSGMEMALLFLFTAGAWYGYTKGDLLFSGLMCGLLLWTRIDSVVFVAV